MGRLRTEDDDRPIRRVERPSTDIRVPVLDGVTVLVVDDEVDALIMVREILEATGARVITADSAEEALNILEISQPDVLLADVGMPRVSGFELMDQIRRSPNPRIRNLPAAALTAYARSEDRANTLRSGFQLHMAKPIDPSELMAAVASLVKGPPTNSGTGASRER
jgi:CheY-like chemotaxis protein